MGGALVGHAGAREGFATDLTLSHTPSSVLLQLAPSVTVAVWDVTTPGLDPNTALTPCALRQLVLTSADTGVHGGFTVGAGCMGV